MSVSQKYIGHSKYVFGGGRTASDIRNGRFDCSSYVNWAYGQMGINLGNQANASTETLNKKGTRIKTSELRPGDMVFFDTYKKDGHVGIYVGNGKFIGAQSSTGVAVANMSDPYWKSHYSGHARRVSNTSNGKAGSVPSGKLQGLYSEPSSGGGGGSSYTNTYKTRKEALKAPGYAAYKTHLQAAINTGKVPREWIVPLTELVGRESTWNPNVKNGQGSSAYGYAQFLSSTRRDYEKKTGLSYSNPVNQLIMMVQYIKDRYKTPERALAWWDRKQWY